MKCYDIVSFYLGKCPDNNGRMIDDILSWDNERLEYVHDYIQWLFPLKEKSAYNPSAPTISDEEINKFRNSNVLKAKLLESFIRLLEFYGFECQWEGNRLNVVRSSNFEVRSRYWLTSGNHNFLRITRILKCLWLLGLKDHALAFMNALEEVYGEYDEVVGTETLSHWREAIIVH